MDINVTTDGIGGPWTLTDLLGRPMGQIVERPAGSFLIKPKGSAVTTMSGIVRQSYPSLDAALRRIEEQTRSACRLDVGGT